VLFARRLRRGLMEEGLASMFSRKRTETEDPKMADTSDDLGIPMKPVRPVGQTPAPVTAAKPAVPPPRPPDPARPGDSARPPGRPGEPPVAASARPGSDSEARKLIVGRDITLSGEITSCEKLVIEGSVEANLSNCREVDISETGLFKGSAAVEEAEISGRFEGNLTARRRLLIRASGRVSGTIRYGQIEIERGGQISGDVQAQPEQDAFTGVANVRAAE
jgi:cytoskeletal protein CcmA (bactofilin family)